MGSPSLGLPPRHWDFQKPWSSFWTGGKQAPGHQLSLCLASHLVSGFPLVSSGACATFYGHMSSPGSGLSTSSKPISGGDGLLDRVGQLAHEETWPIWPEETV